MEMKQYCQICGFFKEDAIQRNYPQLEAKGIKWLVVLCDICYEGLRARKTTMKDWMQQKVCVPYTSNGPEQQLEDTIHLHITTLEGVELGDVQFESKTLRGYVWGKLRAYEYQHRDKSLIGWQPVLYVTIHNDYRTTHHFVTPTGQKLYTATKFMVYNKKGYMQ
jgi:hypothetical protein